MDNEIKFPEGLTLRDYFAGIALKGTLASPDFDAFIKPIEKIADACYVVADAMIERREK